jgi:uncharacterized protein (TIGR02466 family)
MQIINLFPLSIIKEKISLDQNIKNQMIEEIRTMVKNSKNEKYKSNNSSWTGDTQGFEYICRNEKFKKLFIEIKKKILNYLNHLKINEKAIELYITRSWATVSNGKENISKHKHQQSHISFAYYLKKNDNDSNLIFFAEHFQNEIVPGLFTNSTVRSRGIIKENTLFNTPSIDIKTEEDDILIFPSKADHGTQPHKINDERISISADIVCVAKNSELLETIMPPLQNWDQM